MKIQIGTPYWAYLVPRKHTRENGTMSENSVIQLRAPDGEICWTMVELQGSLENKMGSLDGSIWGHLSQLPDVCCCTSAPRSLPCTKLTFHPCPRPSQGGVSLRVGMQTMPGEYVKLKKPLAVLSKHSEGEGGSRRYDAVGLIRQKLVFKSRPSPITRVLAPAKGLKRSEPETTAESAPETSVE